ncbi:MAG: glycosyltransferase [Ruminiclostridium sp.]|nr:glycosyltransferase [Ruminiclostridium sp.]MBQ8841238.1 glycosyltransferase [Ruminiclostridium sp.]
MLLQKIVAPEEGFGYPEMYLRGSETLSLKAGETITLDTYYNSFSYTQYRAYTKVDIVKFTMKFSGSLKVQLYVYNGEEKIVSECTGENFAEVSAKLWNLPEKGFLYPKITALSDTIITEAGYYSEAVPKSINCCIAFCTFRREQYIINNLKRLKSMPFTFIKKIFVIDNGNTLSQTQLTDDFVSVLKNKNYGGSGGFTRGLIEAYNGEFTHVILMDDDVELMPEKLEQMTVFMSFLKDEYASAHFSAAMLSDSKPYIQYEMGASWSGTKIINSKHNVDIRDRDVLFDNLSNDNIQYGAWWCFCLPVSDIDKHGLPFPFFIKFDDVEYGLRCCKKSNIITMNGVAVRHEDFDKKYSMHLEYYAVRNQLVMNEALGLQGMGSVIRKLISVTARHTMYYRYENLDIVYRAFKDFLKGVDFFLECDDEKLNTELMKKAMELRELTKIKSWNEDMRNDEHYGNNYFTPAMVLTLGGHLVPSFLLKKEVTAVPLSRLGLSDTFLRKEVIQYQIGGNSGVLTKRSFSKFLSYSFKSLGMMFRIIFTYGKARKSFRKRKGEITGMSFWKNHLGL